MNESPGTHAARIFFVALAFAAPAFALAKWAGLDGRPWSVVLSAAIVTSALVATWRLAASSMKVMSSVAKDRDARRERSERP